VLVRALVLFWLAGCGGGGDTEPAETDDEGGACGDVTTHDVTVIGRAETADGPADGATVTLQERNWTSGDTFGTATTGADGSFQIDAVGVIGVEDCWGTALDYVIAGSLGDLAGERDVNSALFNAVTSGEDADVSGSAILLE
jgi:hypothetical protein